MQIDKIHNFLSNPNISDANEIIELKNLNKQYPFCQLFTIMYLSVLNNNKDINFDEELNKNAYKIRDRKKLYYFLNDSKLILNEEIINKVNSNNEDKILSESKNINEELKVVQESKIEEIEKSNEVINIENDLEKEYLSTILSSSYQIEQLPEKKHEIITDNTKKTFTDWLNITENDKIDNLQNLSKETNKSFEIKEKQEIYSPIKKAKESIKDDKIIYSETLANIYAMQGNYPKAIEAFKQLMLSIPEKNLYFAKKIEELTIKNSKQ